MFYFPAKHYTPVQPTYLNVLLCAGLHTVLAADCVTATSLLQD